MVQLADVAPGEGSQKSAERRGRSQRVAEHVLAAARAQRISIVNAFTAGQGRVDQGHGLKAGIGPSRPKAEVHVLIDKLTQAQVLRQRRGLDQPGKGDSVVIIKAGSQSIEGRT
jgi:hypothetical protein